MSLRAGPLRKGGRRLTQALFYEYAREGIQPSYTIRREHINKDGVDYISLRDLYMECLDPTEELFVQLAFDGDWDQWRMIKNNDVLASALKYNEWQEELSIKLRSLGIQTIVKEAKSGSNKSIQAARWLAEEGWRVRGRGRPSNAERKRAMKEDDLLKEAFSEDLERIGWEE